MMSCRRCLKNYLTLTGKMNGKKIQVNLKISYYDNMLQLHYSIRTDILSLCLFYYKKTIPIKPKPVPSNDPPITSESQCSPR